MFQKVLIANRGEIALRVIRACQEMGLQTVAVHSTADQDSMHVRFADESVCIGGPSSKDSYLNIQAILSAAEISGAEAVHPGVGFLSENAEFATMVQEHGLKFIGPSPEHITLMGDKITAKNAVKKLGIPVVPGSDGPVTDIENAVKTAGKMGYPVIVKAASGGGGKGMQVCNNEEEIRERVPIAQTEARINFGNDQVFIEKYLMKPRHIEIQVLGDSFGNAVHLGERDCSLQRRHQKVWEEANSPAVTEDKRHQLGETARQAVAEMGYEGAGTFEFLYENEEFYFIEMNTRIQVEHTITEMVTDVDLVREQIRIAQGEKLSFSQKDIQFRGHAIECRINAEHPETFAPSPGKVTGYHAPGGIGVRVDSHLYAGYTIPPHYDSMISKLIVFADSREKCILRLRRALDEYVIEGPQTIIPLHQQLVRNPDVIAGNYDIHWLENWLAAEEKKKKEASGQAA